MGESNALHTHAMEIALEEAALAAQEGEVPVGAVITHAGEIIARGRNRKETAHDPVGHAEIVAIRAAAQVLGRWRLSGCTLVVTLEPCPMCAGAIVHARMDCLVFGTRDPRTGAAGSLMNLVRDPRFNHQAEVVEGVLVDRCSHMLKTFFAERRRRATKM